MGFLLEIIRLGLSNLRLHKLRSFLTSLGIILGVAAVIVMVSIGEGSKQAILREIQSLGATNVILRSVRPPESSNFGSQERSFVASFGLKFRDLRRLDAALGDYADHIVPLKTVGGEINYDAKRTTSQSYGVTPELQKVANLHIARGRYLTDQDMDQSSRVCVLGHQIAEQFFPLADPLGADIRIDDRIFRVVGVLKPIGLAGGTGSKLVGRDLNKDVHIPLTTAMLEFGDMVWRRVSGSTSAEQIELSEIYVEAPTTESVELVSALVRRVIADEHSRQNDVEVIVPWELLETEKKQSLIWDIVLISVAAISLLIGGIGIMNIMLATVTERTREIGIRRALGATRQHIVAQFLVETGSLSAVGGLIGIGVGVGLSLVVGRALPAAIDTMRRRGWLEIDPPTLETQITSWSILVSFMVAAFVGLAFGIYPAIVASRKDPIEALRHD